MRTFFRKFVCSMNAVVLLVFACTEMQTAGPSTEEGNPQIVAVVVDHSNHPVQNARVTAYLDASNPDSMQEPSTAMKIAAKNTDAYGKCTFDTLPAGVYSLLASDSDSSCSVLRTNITLSNSHPAKPEFSDTLVLAAPCSIRGVVTRGGVPGTISNQNLRDAFIQVKIGEIDRFFVTGTDGTYSFSNLPSGTYSIYYYATDGFYMAKKENIVVPPGKDTLIDTVRLTPVPRLIPPAGFRASYDSLAQVVNLSWERVSYALLRWYEVERIDVSGPYDTVFICRDTMMVDTLKSIPAAVTLDYVVRSVDSSFNKSQNAGPAEILVK